MGRRWPSRRLLVTLLCGASVAFMAPVVPAHAGAPDDAQTALIMGGTFMPTPSQRWQDAVVADYINPATGADHVPVVVPYPASGASTSIPTGLANLAATMAQQPDGQPYVVAGYSQSAQIAVLQKIDMMQSGQPDPDVTFLLLGSGNRPNGGFLERFDGLVIPGMPGLNFNGAAPTDGDIATIDVAAQYDANADFPQYPINLVAVLNAFLGFLYTHGGYAGGPLPQLVPAVWPPSQPLVGPFVDEYVAGSTDIVRQVTGDTTFYFIPTAELPLLSPLRTLGVPESWLEIVQPALRVIVEAGYDRSVPFGEPVPAQLIPIIDPATFLVDFTRAVVQGADNALALFGADLPGYAELMELFEDVRAWTASEIGEPYAQAVSWLNDYLNPFTAFTAIEGPIGEAIQLLFDVSGVQEYLLDPALGLIGTLGGLVTS
ncbi:PE-PPE domain-containing protein [Mycolicibacter hiberniae]|uniref:PE-PPE domain-containing protein n=1 Tax=Mycolicibacter hiberniae TaxID=29314 RepID=UPI0013D4E35F|nr:PE-PPE domain-containing protein [Mycolicibacter hiberniae]MCV7086735.1 PE-PPE domain-containing protein [Mycolicibacter hiberniae]